VSFFTILNKEEAIVSTSVICNKRSIPSSCSTNYLKQITLPKKVKRLNTRKFQNDSFPGFPLGRGQVQQHSCNDSKTTRNSQTWYSFSATHWPSLESKLVRRRVLHTPAWRLHTRLPSSGPLCNHCWWAQEGATSPVPESDHTTLRCNKRWLQRVCAHHRYSTHVRATSNGFYFNSTFTTVKGRGGTNTFILRRRWKG